LSDLLDTLDPKPLWHYFLELSKLPRGSKHEGAAADWVAAQGRALGCEVLRDAVGNVLLRKAGSPGREGRPGVALQCHVDMVCEKNEGTAHDFLRDPIRVRRDGDLLRATGTTLGADNGIGVAAGLAVLAARDLSHAPLELLVTVDEETGLTGANHLQPGWLRAATLLNLDSEEEGVLTIGCAGGIDTLARRRVTAEAPVEGAKALRVKVAGLKGGHSGMEIAAGRGNSLRILGQVLDATLAAHSLQLASVAGGNKRNAIPREASAIVLCLPEHEAALAADVARLCGDLRLGLGAFDPGLAITLEPGSPASPMTLADARAVVGLLLAGPHGIDAMSPDIEGLVQTSTNLGLVETRDSVVEVNFLTRSSIDASKLLLSRRIASIAEEFGFSAANSGSYPGWKPAPGAAVVALVDSVHREVFGKPMAIKAIHAGLECGLIGEKHPGLEMASLGPNMWDVHTPDENVSVSSVKSFWTLLTAVLARL
jgi:dipeptidase D